MKAALATIAVLVLALGLTSEAVQVEVSTSPNIYLWLRLHGLGSFLLIRRRNVFIYKSRRWQSYCTDLRYLPLWITNNTKTFKTSACTSIIWANFKSVFSSRRMDSLSPWKASRGFRSWQRMALRQHNKTHDSGQTPCPSVPTPCSHRSSCPSASREEDLHPSPD